MVVNSALKYRFLFLSSLVLLVSLIPTGRVSADAAPPQAPPGSSIATEDFETNVQMVSEEVVIDVGYYPGQDVSVYSDQTIEELSEQEFIWGHSILSTGDLYAHVDATFIMKNQGDQDEAFDVWFPVETTDGWFEKVHVVNFQAWVNGVPSEFTERMAADKYGDASLWAIWPTTFPVGEEVVIRVSYDIPPNYDGSYRRFEYILETGAGWYDVIGEGTFIVRLPYEATSENSSFGSFSLHLTIERSDLLLSGNEIRWQFTDLEPVRNGNIYLLVLDPAIWAEVQTARTIAAANPDSVEAQLDLAQTLEKALLANKAKAAYEHALELSPENIDIYVAYLELLMPLYPQEPLPEEFLPTLEHALELAPEDPRLLKIEDTYHLITEMISPTSTPTIQPTPTSLPTEMPSPTVYLSPTPRPTQTPAPTDLPAPEHVSPSSNQSNLIPIVVIALIALLGIASRLLMRQG